MPPFKDLTGQRFGRWVVQYRTTDHTEPDGTKRVRYHCVCDCGNEADVISGSLSKGKSKSCGCLQREYAKTTKIHYVHGCTGTRLHRVWKNMHTRCYNKNNHKYKVYGSRGITICDEWHGDNGFSNFKEWALTHGYADGLTIDRIDNDGNYCPENCRWVNNIVQSNNRSTNRLITALGMTKTIADWERYTGIKRTKMYGKSTEKIVEILENWAS